jgi:hypothetical protein
MAALQPKLPTPQARPTSRAMMPATSATQAYGGGASPGLSTSGMQRPALGGTPLPPVAPTTSVNPAGVMRTTGLQPNPSSFGGPPLIGNIEEIDLDAQRRSRNISDAGQMAQITAAGPGSGGGGGGGGGSETPAAPPLSTEDIFGVLDRLKGETPPREERPAPPNRVAMPTPAAEAPSASMGFARAKDQSGRIGNAALRALKDQMTERGISGSGVEGQLTSNILGDVARGQGEAAFNQQLEADRQSWDAKQMGYQGDITQRAQDLGLSSTGFQGGIQQRGQDMNQNNLLSMGPTILGLLAGRARY